ncbi:dienelactone hydrolase family protein [Crystallibacter degradans]|uniref:dienelactone hydrolase family protein n=1 Tax=Crystallibacter degradans TaxID=2726743 RepID=UPI0014732DAD|nr:dienelactone hydrolase family protein [Arthrobacter sp. SF27]NMR31298.1 dienelactone hydrolase family protein [Arthrobacter sp. SF27]
MGEMVEIGTGENALPVYQSSPGPDIKGGLIVIHEVWGLNDHVKEVADRFAAEGYFVIAPDLLSSTGLDVDVAAQLGEAMAHPEKRSATLPRIRPFLAPLRSKKTAAGIIANAKRCFDYLKGNDAVAGRIAVTGFSFGGTYAWSLAVHEPELKAAVPFYGHADFTVDEFRNIGCPVLAFYGERDSRLIEKLPQVEAGLQEAGLSFRSVIYPNAGHAFFNDRNPKAYNEAAAMDAWNRSLAFLDRHLN